MNWDVSRQTERFSKAAHAVERERKREERDEDDPTIPFFWAFLGCHVLFWTILTALTQPNLPAETLELLTAGQSPAWGYYDQPPLAVWLMSIVAAIFVPAAWPAYFLAQICIATCLWAAWRIGREFLHPWTAICGAAVLEGCFFFTIGSAALTSAHLAGAMWALAIVSLYNGFQLEHRRDWVFVGIFLGLGMLSHYSTALLFLAMIIFSLMNGQARLCWDTSWPFLAGAIMGVTVLPHFWWAWSNDFNTFTTSLHSWDSMTSHGAFTFQFIFLQLLAVVPVVILLVPMISYFSLEEPTNSEDEERDFVRQYLLFVTFFPAALMLALALIVGVDLGATGLTLWTFLGVILLIWSELKEGRLEWRRVLLNTGAVGGGFAALLVVVNFMMPFLINTSEPSDIHFPGKALAKEVRGLWKEHGNQKPLAVVGGPKALAQNASWYHGTFHRPLVYSNLDETHVVGVDDQFLFDHGGVIVWTDTDAENYTKEILYARLGNERYDNLTFVEEPVAVNWESAAFKEPLLVHAAIVQPAVREETQAPEAGAPLLQDEFPQDDFPLSSMPAVTIPEATSESQREPTPAQPESNLPAFPFQATTNADLSNSGSTIPVSTAPASTIPRSDSSMPRPTPASPSASTIPVTAPSGTTIPASYKPFPLSGDDD